MDKILDVFNYKSYFYWMKKRLSVTNFSSENNLPMFRLNAAVIIRVKVKRCEQTLLFIAMHYWGYMSLEVKCRWGLLLPASTSQRSSNQGLPVLHLGWSAPLRMSSGCAGPPSPTAPVLCHGPALWGPPSGSDGDSPMHASLQLTSPSSPSRRHLSVPLLSSGLPYIDLAAAAGDTIYHIGLLTKR